MTLVAEKGTEGFVAIPLGGLFDSRPLPFPLYLEGQGQRPPVLYCQEGSIFDNSRVQMLRKSGVRRLLLPAAARRQFWSRLEEGLDVLVRDATIPMPDRAAILQGTAHSVAEDLFTEQQPSREELRRAERVIHASTLLVVRDPSALLALRRVLGSGEELAGHSVNVAMLSIGLASVRSNVTPEWIAKIGLAGLLHDIGRVGFDLGEPKEDPAHCMRGKRQLEELGMPSEVVEAAALHHEREDGSGLPHGLRENEIPFVAKVVGLVDVFDELHTKHATRISLYDCLSIFARSYRGCFDEKMMRAFIMMFRS
ncbi:MAG: hypothetical protein CSA62_15360 [Planctomycetota bacterium]|nr:MAG: hypothetical protein CSA62_15360 [Planctomycetota bacterium]